MIILTTEGYDNDELGALYELFDYGEGVEEGR